MGVSLKNKTKHAYSDGGTDTSGPGHMSVHLQTETPLGRQHSSAELVRLVLVPFSQDHGLF